MEGLKYGNASASWDRHFRPPHIVELLLKLNDMGAELSMSSFVSALCQTEY